MVTRIRRRPEGPRTVIPFKTIRARAEKRKGGPKALARLLPPKPDPKALAKLGDDRILAEMTRRVFSAGFAWSVIETKWPGFEKAFLGFKPGPLTLQPDEFWDGLMKDTRIVRNGAKIMSVRANAGFVQDVGEGARQLRQVPREVAVLRRGRAARTAGEARQPARRQYRADDAALPRLGRVRHVEGRGRRACAMPASTSPKTVTSKRDLAKVQAQFNAWAEETGLPYVQLSRICAMSIGENYAAEKLASMIGADD